MKSLLPLFFFLFTLSLFTQNLSLKTGTTRAVIIGISDYEDGDIPDLKFAHKDAEVFLEYLKSPAGGGITEENYKFLTNEKATIAQIGAALGWLLEMSKRGDKVIIYFSGHGDVENRTDSGFLLTWNTLSKVYISGGLPINYLQNVITSLSTKNQSEVLLVTDACRAGNLAGSSINGSQLANANLAKQFANEVKILSCQPNEFSIEGEQWGGGRGVFSYHLIDGMVGLADKDDDLQVKLYELDRYLEDKVSNETDPHSQFPMVVGNKSALVSIVDAEMVTKIRERKSKELPQFYASDNKALASMFPENIDSNAIQLYETFTAQVDAGNLLTPKDSSAYDLYLDLMTIEEIKPLHGTIKRNLAAALQDESQSVLNGYLKADPEELQRRYEESEKYAQYPQYIEKAAEILGPENYFYNHLLSNLNYFEGLQLRLAGDNENEQDSLRYEEAILKQKEALSYQPRSPYVLNELGVLHTRLKRDSIAFGYYDQVIELTPEWGLPYVNYSIGLYYAGDIEKAIEMGEKAGEFLPEFPQVYVFLAWLNGGNWDWKADRSDIDRKGTELDEDFEFEWNQMNTAYQNRSRFEKSIQLLNKAIDLDSTYAKTYFHKGKALSQMGKFNLAEKNYQKYISLNPLDSMAYAWLGMVYSAQNQHEKAIEMVRITAEKDPTWNGSLAYIFKVWNKPDSCIKYQLIANEHYDEPFYWNIAEAYFMKYDYRNGEHYGIKMLETATLRNLDPSHYRFMGQNYFNLRRYEDAEWCFRKAIEQNSKFSWAMYNLAQIYLVRNDYENAFEWQNKALENSPDDPEILHQIGQTYFLTGYPEKAEECFQKAITHDVWSYSNMIGWLYKNHGEFELAEKYLKPFSESKKSFHADANLAIIYALQGNYKKAVQWLEKSIPDYPIEKDPTAVMLDHMRIVYSFYAYPDSARVIFEEAEKKYPKALKLFDYLTQIENGNYKEAYQTYRTYRWPIQTWFIAHKYLGILVQKGDMKGAIEYMNRSNKVVLNYTVLTTDSLLAPLRETEAYQKYIRKNFPEKFERQDRYQGEQASPIYYAENCMELGQYYELEEEWLRAEFHYHKAIELIPDSTEYFQTLQKLYNDHPEISFKKSEKALKEAIKAEPENVENYLTLSTLYRQLNEPENASHYLEKFLNLEIGDAASFVKIGDQFSDMEELEKAILSYEKAFEYAPNDYSTNTYLYKLEGVLYKAKKYERAIEICKKAIELIPTSENFWKVNLAKSYFMTNKKEMTKSLMDEVINSDDLTPDLIYSLGDTYVEVGDIEAVENVIQLSIEKFPDNSEAFYNHATIYAQAEMPEKAIAQLSLSFEKGFKYLSVVKKDSDLDNIRDTPEFKALLEKYFPEETKK